MKDFGSFFSGGGGVDIGAKAAGWNLVFANEYIPKIAQVYARNLGDHVRVGSLLDMDVEKDFPRVDWFHASPPCPNFSKAKRVGGGETDNDMLLAAQVCRYIAHHLPTFVTLENVCEYEDSESFRAISKQLRDSGYLTRYWFVNMADYGVPQTRQRRIVVARRDGVPPSLPQRTHAQFPQPVLFGEEPKRWIGWYEAVEDLVPDFVPVVFPPGVRKLTSTCGLDIFTVNPNRTSELWQRKTDAIDGSRPYPTIAAEKSIGKFFAQIHGVEYRMTFGAIRRLCTFPDSYESPVFKVLGNAVPPLFAEKLGKHLMGGDAGCL